ncbi:hypothetical protein [Bacillus sp. JCM 19041]|uniref:hypothetical protein n=1 Tax=Bacillus sp. JCM 19041 TaxID=1460637 RepID=UPI0006D0BEAA
MIVVVRHGETDLNTNVLIPGHRCTTGMIGAYFNSIPADNNIFIYSSNNGVYRTYSFKSKQ